MLKSPLQLIVSLLTVGLFVTTLVLYAQEAETYVPEENKRWERTSWDFILPQQK